MLTTTNATASPATKVGRHRPQDTDRHVGSKIRQRRVILGLRQHQIAELIGVTYQQQHKYEIGINRISAGRLHRMAQALDVEVGYFFEDLPEDGAVRVECKDVERHRFVLGLTERISQLSRNEQDALSAVIDAFDSARAAG